MIILPAIDIKGGTCVRLYKGDYGTAEKVAEDPIETARRFKEAGARWMHMVDLDGAKSGKRVNRELILKTVKASGLQTELGGGIRDMGSLSDYLENGVARVILGSAALTDPGFLRQAVKTYGDRVAVGIDARGGMVATHGWLKTSEVEYTEFAKRMEDAGVKYAIFTDIDCDGTLGGPNFEQLERLKRAVGMRIIASGGIRDIGHIKRLAEMGLYGAVCGKSLYSGTLSLSEAVIAGGDQDACQTHHPMS